VYRAPSRRTKRVEVKKPNLIPILDAVFIFIFFLLMSASFIRIYEIPSVVPILNPGEPPRSDRPPLALTLRVGQDSIVIHTGVPSRPRHTIGKTADGRYDLEELRAYLIQLKRDNLEERTAILEPLINITYEELVEIMDAVRIIRRTDPSLYTKDEAGMDVRVNELFDNIVFGNI
jgi:biopolymer transport protein ExbD